MYKRILTAVVLILPTSAFAAGTVGGGIGATIDQFDAILKFFLGIALPLALAVFFWGLIKFISKGEDAKLKESGKKMMLSSGIALFLMVGIWSVLGWLQTSTGLDQYNQLNVQSQAPDISNVTGI